MKKTIQHLSTLCVLAVLSMTTISCSSDDDSTAIQEEDPIPNSELNGTITENTTLEASVTYNLTGILSVDNGATLTIPAGTTIHTGTGTDVYVVIQKGAKIDVQGTANAPVKMKPNSAGQWGGLVVLGDASTTAGSDATAEVGGLIYGGSNDSDNSGSIEYLIIEQSGAQINADSQYNGLTLYAVGSGTNISNIAIIDGTDDGIEFFGGTVNASNIYVENLEDDAIDWTEGWNGTLTNTYVLHTEAGFSTALEADGFNGNPSIINFTAISQVGGKALQFKAESGASITGLSLSGYETSIDMANDGPLSNVQIEGEDASLLMDYNVPATVEVSAFSWTLN